MGRFRQKTVARSRNFLPYLSGVSGVLCPVLTLTSPRCSRPSDNSPVGQSMARGVFQGGIVGHRTLNHGRMNRPPMRGLGAISCPSDAPTGASAFTTTARLRLTLLAAVAMLLLAMLPSVASAQGTIGNFSVKRTQSLPSSLFPAGAGFAASALGYPSFGPTPIIGL